MLSQERIRCTRVVVDAKVHLLEPGNGVTRLALSAIRALSELAIVRITVAIGALTE